jgi:2-methylisocitrate lyase-like PEP mutase family enzyme
MRSLRRQAGREHGFVVARTDAREPLGLEPAIDRCLAYKEAGADALFVEAPRSVEELERIAEALPAPLVANMIEGGVTPHLTRSELEQLGFALVVCPLAALYASARAVTDVLTELRDRETTAGTIDRLLGFDEFGELVELDARYADEARYT